MKHSTYHTTRHTPFIVTGLFFLLAVLTGLYGCGEQPRAETGKIRVVTGILPYSDLVSQIGGDHVQVTTLIPSGKNPHTFELDPRRVMNVNKADLVIFNGAGLEMWADKVAEGLTGNTQALWADRVIQNSLMEMDDHGHEGHHHSGGYNPHFWLDPVLMKSISSAIRDALIQCDPKREEYYTTRCEVLLARLDSLDTGIRSGISHWRTLSFVTTHSAWSYFCKRYGLHEAGVLEASPGKEISAKQMARIAQDMDAKGLNVIFTQYMFPDAVAHALARETGAKIAELDPYGNENTSEHYIELMKYNFDTMNAVMR